MAAVEVVAAVAMDRVGRKLDEVYFASKRIGASAGNIRAFDDKVGAYKTVF